MLWSFIFFILNFAITKRYLRVGVILKNDKETLETFILNVLSAKTDILIKVLKYCSVSPQLLIMACPPHLPSTEMFSAEAKPKTTK